MSCLKISDIYAYLEGDFSPGQRDQAEKHLSGCPRCRAALEERRLLGEAFASLPPLDLPANFSQRVMSTIPSARRLLPSWLITLAAGSSAASLLFILFLRSGTDFLSFLSGIDNSLWGYAKSAAVFAVKAVTLVSAVVRALQPVGRALSNTLFQLASVISPAAQAAIVIASSAVLAALLYLIGKRFRLGERI
jgi:anti-sigma factor RsiW